MFWRVAGGLLLLVGGCGGAPAPVVEARARAVMPGPAPLHRVEDAAARNADCVACHDEIASEWEGSLHREAYTSPAFQHALRSEPLPFCRGCHAPEAETRRPEPALAAIGVACVSCHLPAGDAVLSGRAVDAPNEAPHAVLRDPEFAGAGACAGCHEFKFPDARPVPEYMQTTVQEHAASQHAGSSCASCHMPRVADGEGTHPSHAFMGARDEDRMRAAVVVAGTRPAAERIEVSLDLQEDRVGHAFPTGDLLRRLVVEVRPEGRAQAVQRRYLTRHWEQVRFNKGPQVRTLVSDDRLGVGEDPRVVAFTLAAEDVGLPVRWRVRYERVEAFMTASEDGAIVVGGMELASGVLAPL